jgi:hypothetical protein
MGGRGFGHRVFPANRVGGQLKCEFVGCERIVPVSLFLKENRMHNGSSIVGLVKELRQQVKTFLREEVHLAKTELSEKISSITKDSVSIAVGGFVAYAGLIIFLGALGVLLGFVLQRQGLDPLLAEFIGLGAVGLIIIAVGAILLLGGLKALKKESLAPERTIETLQRAKGTEPPTTKEIVAQEMKEKKDERSSKEIETSVIQTEKQMAETLEELEDRLTMTHLRQQADAEVRKHPYRWSLVAMGAGVCGSYLMKRKLVR